MRKRTTVARRLPARRLYSIPPGAEEGRDAVCLAEAHPQAQPRPSGGKDESLIAAIAQNLRPLTNVAGGPAMGLDRSSRAQEKRSTDRAATDPSLIRASGGSRFEAKRRPGEFYNKVLELLAIYRMAISESPKDRRGAYFSRGSTDEPVAAAVDCDQLRRFKFLVVVGLGLGLLAGCAHAPPAAPPQTAALQPPPLPVRAPSPHPRVFPLPPRKPTPPPEESGAEADAGLSSSGLERTPSASQLIGLDEAAATRLFGSAVEETEMPPAKTWRYRSANCELDLIFYLNLRTGKMRAIRYAFKEEPAGPVDQQNCLRSLVVARRG